MSQRGDYRNMLFLVGFFALGLTLTGFSIVLDTKLNGSNGKKDDNNQISLTCRNELILWCNRIILVISLMIVGVTLMSIIYNAYGIDASMGIKDTGKFYGSYSILLILLGVIILILASIMLGKTVEIDNTNTPATDKNASDIECGGKNEMIAIVITSFIFIAIGIGMSVISWNLAKNKTNTSGVYIGANIRRNNSGVDKKSDDNTVCKKGVYLEPGVDLNKNIEKKHGIKLNYKAGDCEERFPCFDPNKLRCYKLSGEEDSSWKEETETFRQENKEKITKSINRIVKKRRKKCNENPKTRWDNDETDYLKACKNKSEMDSSGLKANTESQKYNWRYRWRDDNGLASLSNTKAEESCRKNLKKKCSDELEGKTNNKTSEFKENCEKSGLTDEYKQWWSKCSQEKNTKRGQILPY